jgi:GMP synthase (glutamine-hydrolysing)
MQKIVVVDYGSQYNHLIARRIRELGVYSELWASRDVAWRIKNDPDVTGIVLSGGPNSVYEKDAPSIEKSVFDLGIPVLGICYGMQLMAHLLGGSIHPSEDREYGRQILQVHHAQTTLFQNTSSEFPVFMSHGDQVGTLGDWFVGDASSPNCPFAAIHHRLLPLYGIQFHPEVVHTAFGNVILGNFLDVCGCRRDWRMGSIAQAEVARIQNAVGETDRVLLGLSGGVDSSVAALLLHKAIGERLTCMFIDHGLLRSDEVAEVMSELTHHFHLHVVVIDASKRFLEALKGVVDPEQKRKIIGDRFIRVFAEEAAKLGHFRFLAQGTLYTDIIESGTHTAQTIKSHHNVGGLPKDMPFELVEPLKTLFKDEVRRLGEELGMPSHLVWRQPFPGPGLAIRIIGEVTRERIKIVQASDKILRDEFAKAGLNKTVWQYFTVLTNSRTVGVMGDGRTYDETVAIRAVTSVDGMTADWAKVPYEVLDLVSRRIVNEVKGVNRIVYDITSKPPATIEWE